MFYLRVHPNKVTIKVLYNRLKFVLRVILNSLKWVAVRYTARFFSLGHPTGVSQRASPFARLDGIRGFPFTTAVWWSHIWGSFHPQM